MNKIATKSQLSGADTDSQVVNMWLAGRPELTEIAYRRDSDRLFRAVEKPLSEMTARDLVDFANTLKAGPSHRSAAY